MLSSYAGLLLGSGVILRPSEKSVPGWLRPLWIRLITLRRMSGKLFSASWRRTAGGLSRLGTGDIFGATWGVAIYRSTELRRIRRGMPATSSAEPGVTRSMRRTRGASAVRTPNPVYEPPIGTCSVCARVRCLQVTTWRSAIDYLRSYLRGDEFTGTGRTRTAVQ
jgi:hypothetical protein